MFTFRKLLGSLIAYQMDNGIIFPGTNTACS